jgi:hypothetical protein
LIKDELWRELVFAGVAGIGFYECSAIWTGNISHKSRTSAVPAAKMLSIVQNYWLSAILTTGVVFRFWFVSGAVRFACHIGICSTVIDGIVEIDITFRYITVIAMDSAVVII